MFKMILAIVFVANINACSKPIQHAKAETTQTEPTVAAPTDETAIDTSWTEKVVKTNEEWKKILTPDQYHITREQGTERPFTSEFYNNHEEGVFICVCCKNPLFGSETKFNSGTGWPSYYAPYSSKSVSVSSDNSLGMTRDEIACQRCDAHLGHVFDDGPKPTGLRYCIDGVALQFVKKADVKPLKKAVFAAGCFWCMEAIFESVKGVKDVVSGYAGGTEKNPTYEQVGDGKTSHAEAIEVLYDPNEVSFAALVRVFFAGQDPTQVDGQGPDHGKQYRTIAFYSSPEEKTVIDEQIAKMTQSGEYSKPIAAQVAPTSKFWIAEDYHQNYVQNNPGNPYVQHESIPRLRRAQQKVKDLIAPEKLLK